MNSLRAASRLVLLAIALPIAGGARQAPTLQKPAAAPAAAQAPDYSQEPFILEEYITRARWESDGTGRSESTVRFKVQSEAGVQQLGELPLGYNSANQKLTVDYVRVKKGDGTVVTAAPDAVKDLSAPISREAPMYTDFRQKHITVPGLRPGEALEYKFTIVTDPPLAPGHFWMEHNFEKLAITLDEQLEINVPRSREVKLKTQPGADPKITEEGDRRIYRWSSSFKERPSEEEQEKRNRRTRRKEPEPASVRLTTFQSWEEIGRWYAALEKDRIVPTPEIRAKAAELTKDKKSGLEKTEALYAYVARNFRYVSLSFGVGRVQPHAASEVFANQYGDCKDKHTLLAAMLSSVGVASSAVLISSQRKLEEDFPSPLQFDHAITLAFAPGSAPSADALLWMDTTTEVAPFRLLSANLRGKKALVVNRQALPWERRIPGPEVAETPKDPPFPARQEVEIDAKANDLGKLTSRLKYVLRGDTELLLRAAFRRTPQTKWKDLAQMIAYSDGFRGEVSELKVGDPSDTGEPFRIEFDVTQTGYLDYSSKKATARMPLPSAGLPPAGEDPDEEDKSPEKDEIELGSPVEVHLRLRLELPARYAVRLPVGISVSRDYAEYKSSYTLAQNTVTAERALRFKLHDLPGARRNDFLAFTGAVRNDESQSLQLESAVAGSAAIPEDAKADDLYKTGLTALRNGNLAVAAELLRKVTEMEPRHRGAWNELGRVYMVQRRFAEAEAAFQRQIEVNPFDQFAHNNLGRAYWQQQKYSEAEAAFRKQLEVNPLDRYAYGNLGQMLNEQKKYAQAIPLLERAIAITSEDVNLHVGLGTALLNTGENEKAVAAFDKAVELTPAPGVWNNIAYQLSLKKTHLDRALQYAESAVSATSAALRNISLETVTMREMAQVNSVAAYWDTLGWVHFQRGELDKAGKYIQASWMLAQHGEVGDHWGQIHEKQGRRQEAMLTYARALAATRPLEETHGRLLKLAGSETKAKELRAQAGAELSQMRTVKLGRLLKESANADFLVVVGAAGKVEDLKFISGDERLRALMDKLRGAAMPVLFPDETPVRLVRRGMLSCSGATGECVFVLILPDHVVSVD